MGSKGGLAPWWSFADIDEMEQRFQDIFGKSFLPSLWRRTPAAEMGWTPPTEVFEKDNKLVVNAEIPGMKEEDIAVSVTGHILTIRDERKAEGDVKDEDYYCCEISYGSFSRSITMPSDVDADNIEADYADGALEVSLPKAPEVKPKKISVSAKK
ncbi:MAG: Hsp20/alpha crystallin family protein [Dehalococcoidia bacterium]